MKNIGREGVEFGEVDPDRIRLPIAASYTESGGCTTGGIASSTSRRTTAAVRVIPTMYPLAVARCSQLHRLGTGDIGSRLLGSYAITLFGAAASWARDARLVQDLIPKDDPQVVRCVQVMLTTKTEQAPALAWRPTHVLIVLKVAGCPDHVGAGQGDFNATDTLLFADACPAGAFLDRDLICFDGPSDPKLIAL